MIYTPGFVADIVVASACLHNLCTDRRIPLLLGDDEPAQLEYVQPDEEMAMEPPHRAGISFRTAYIERFLAVAP